MVLQISSGRGPVECELAVGKLADALCEEFPGTEIIQKTPGMRDGAYKSVVLESERDLSFLEGTIKWICPSPFRPNHKRKNWFIDVSPAGNYIDSGMDERLIRFETFRSGGKGGQHVNKVESGVRALYPPLGISAVSTDERSQHMNKKLAKERLQTLFAERDAECKNAVERGNWMEHNRLIRGEAIREYEGMEFRRLR